MAEELEHLQVKIADWMVGLQQFQVAQDDVVLIDPRGILLHRGDLVGQLHPNVS